MCTETLQVMGPFLTHLYQPPSLSQTQYEFEVSGILPTEKLIFFVVFWLSFVSQYFSLTPHPRHLNASGVIVIVTMFLLYR